MHVSCKINILFTLQYSTPKSLVMLKSKTFVRKTRSGAIQKVTREHYLRDDLSCGVHQCSLCCKQGVEGDLDPPLDSPSSLCSTPHYLLPDTNILLHQTDFLEDQAITHVVIPQIALQVRNRDLLHIPLYLLYLTS